MKLYLAGPMTGLPNYNFDEFHAVAAKLRSAGYEVLNPAENFDGRQDLEWSVYLREAVRQVSVAEAVAVLSGWEGSKGARLEITIARALGMRVLDAYSMRKLGDDEVATGLAKSGPPGDILDEAKATVNGDRQAAYGKPEDCFERIARSWSAKLGIEISARQAALLLADMKVCREWDRPKRDNLVDLAGYAWCASRCASAEHARA